MFLLSLSACALAFGLAVWVAGEPWVTHADVRSRQEVRPFWWPWIVALSRPGRFFVTWRFRAVFERRRAMAGLALHWEAEQWVALQGLLAMVAAAIVAVLLAASAPHSMKLWLLGTVVGALLGGSLPSQVLRRKTLARRQAMMRELPFLLDLLTLCVESGLGLSSALKTVMRHAPAGPLIESLRSASALERTGLTRAQWLARWMDLADIVGVRSLVMTLAQAEQMGMSLGPLLRAQSARQRSERFLRAEQRALEAPVKMLFPMVLCIFPCTFLVIGFPIVVRLMDSGF